MLPVMFAVKTCPNAMKLRASITPVLNVSAISAIVAPLPVEAPDCIEFEVLTVTASLTLPALRAHRPTVGHCRSDEIESPDDRQVLARVDQLDLQL